MSTISLILSAHPDGTLHLPLSEELRGSTIRIEATLKQVPEVESVPCVPGCLKGFWMAPDFDEPLDDFRE